MRVLLGLAVTMALGGCAVGDTGRGQAFGSAPLRGFGLDVDAAVSARVPTVHLKTCGPWGCHEQDVPLAISGPTSAAPCPSDPSAAGAACGVVQLPGPGPGYGYAPVPALTVDPVTVTVTTPRGAPLRISARVRVQPHLVCPSGPAADATTAASTCAGAAPQAQLRIAADGTVRQSR
jgi:hypothetical protein